MTWSDLKTVIMLAIEAAQLAVIGETRAPERYTDEQLAVLRDMETVVTKVKIIKSVFFVWSYVSFEFVFFYSA
jgi:hypothetical protein